MRIETIKRGKARRLSIFDKARRLARAIGAIAASGASIAPREVRKERGKICKMCIHWRDNGNLGLGECEICGCSKYKRLFLAQHCPIGKW